MQQYVFFGASGTGKIAYEQLKDKGNISCFVDNDSTKWGTKINGVEVVSPDKLKNLKDTKVVITSMYDSEIAEQLKTMGINQFEVFTVNAEVKPYVQ